MYERIRDLREDHDHTQRDISNVLHCTQVCYSHYENGKRSVPTAVLEALAEGKPVLLYTPGLPDSPKNRALAADLASSRRQLKNWGVVFTDGGRKRLVTAEEARCLRSRGELPAPGAVLTPLAKEILGGE